MRIELVDDNNPLRAGVGFDGGSDMIREVFLGAGVLPISTV